jgi:hypothetical protein
MNALAQSYLFWIALILGLLGLYVLPSVIAGIRGVEGLGWIIVINLLPTGVGWLAALIAALALPRREARAQSRALQLGSGRAATSQGTGYYPPTAGSPGQATSSHQYWE